MTTTPAHLHIVIDPEFRALIPPPTPEERQQLEANLLKDGCRDALVTWHGILLDGHTRHEICTAHKIPFGTIEQACADRDAAKLWILQHQLGRRNLNDFQKAELVIQLEPLLAAQAKARQESTQIGAEPRCGSFEPDHQGRTAEALARIAGISASGMRRALKIRASGSPELQAQVRSGEVSLTAAAENCYAGRTGPITRRQTPPPSEPTTRPTTRNDRKEAPLDPAAQLIATLLAELRRQRKANHDSLEAKRWAPDTIVKRWQTEQLNWIETELERLVHVLTPREVTHPPSPDRAPTARTPRATAGDHDTNGNH